ncbi:MAG: Mrp/NBP35 family ATP-binding protein [Deltaproteobacteria bacterium]|nr:Mrp/NBP35 family ATP-binding protein [Deltaproteobacteria bacterium]
METKQQGTTHQEQACAPTACDSCSSSSCSATDKHQGENQQQFEERRRLSSRLCRIKHKIIVLSGKGGVGKSTVAVNLAMALHLAGKKVGLLDVDIHGPSIPTMLGLEGRQIMEGNGELLPVDLDGMKVISLGFFIKDQDEAVIWRGPMKSGVITQFIRDVAWGDLDYLIVDSPPGTGDEPLSVCQTIEDADGAVIVTTPQKVAAVDVRKSISFCRQLNLPVLGVIENMNGFVCPKCGELTAVFQSGGGRLMADDMGVPFLGSVPIDPLIAEAGDSGVAFLQRYADSQTATIIQALIKPILQLQ